MRDAILVTGASGFIGTHLVRALEAEGRQVYTHSLQDGNIARCELDFDGVLHVYHLAGKTFVPDSWKSPLAFYETNVLGTANVLEFCRRRRASITFVSSYVYGNPISLPISEDHQIRPLNPYSHTKILAEELVRYYNSQFGVASAIVRPFNIYGPGQESHFLVPKLIRQMLDPACDRITVMDLRPRRDYIHVRDLVALLMSTMTVAGISVYNAGSGTSYSIQQLIDEICSVTLTHKPLHSTGESRPEEVLDVVADISKANTELHWWPQISIRKGLSETIAWMQSEAHR
jgi:nucleoside-diphosphate-sugar epimerase